MSGWRAQHLIDAWVNSNDKWIRDITQWSTYYNHQNYIGNNIAATKAGLLAAAVIVARN